jgi:hypothetical protein
MKFGKKMELPVEFNDDCDESIAITLFFRYSFSIAVIAKGMHTPTRNIECALRAHYVDLAFNYRDIDSIKQQRSA